MKSSSQEESTRKDSQSSSEEEVKFQDIALNLKKITHEENRKEIGKVLKSFIRKVKKKNNERVEKIKHKIELLKQINENPKYLVEKDKITYSIIFTSFLFTFGLLFYPNTKIPFYFILAKLSVLFFLRFFEFKRKKWHYYLIEYCYYANALMFFTLIFHSKSKFLLTTLFTNAFGPVASSFLFLRFTIAWHDVSLYTSFFMHMAPALVSWILRFHIVNKHPKSDNNRFIGKEEWDQWLSGMGFMGYWRIFFFGLLFYISWVVPYYYFRFHVLDKRIKRKGNDTLYHYTRENSELYNMLLERFNKNNSVFLNRVIYMSLHGVVSFLSFFVSSLLIYSRNLTLFAVIGLMMMPIWSSSNYYHEYFTEKYGKKIEEDAEENRKKRIEKEEMRRKEK